MKTLRCVDSSHSPERHSLFLNVIFQHREQGDCLRWREGTNLAYFYFLDNFGEYPSSFFFTATQISFKAPGTHIQKQSAPQLG